MTITGEMGDWYKIVPPTGANFYISAQYVDVAGEPVARRMPTTASSGMETTRIVKTATTGPAFNPEVYGKELSSFKELEKKLVEDAKKGAFDTKYFIEKYKALEVTDAGLKRWVKYRLDWLKDVEDSKKRVDESVSIYEETKKSTTELDRQIAGISVTKPPQVGPTSYDAEGVLYESEAFPGGATGPKRYVVRDPAFKRVDGYVVCTTGKVNLKDFLGKRIGIKGAAKFDSDLKLSVIDADEVVLLNDKANVPDSVKPKVVVPGDETTAPTPAPKPMPEIKPTPAPKTTEPAGTEVTTE